MKKLILFFSMTMLLLGVPIAVHADNKNILSIPSSIEMTEANNIWSGGAEVKVNGNNADNIIVSCKSTTGDGTLYLREKKFKNDIQILNCKISQKDGNGSIIKEKETGDYSAIYSEGSNGGTVDYTFYASNIPVGKWQETVEFSFTATDKYTLEFDSGCNLAYEPILFAPAETKYSDPQITIPANPVRPMYSFQGWYTKPNGKGDRVDVAPGIDKEIGGNRTLYAYWEPVPVDVYYIIHYLDSGKDVTYGPYEKNPGDKYSLFPEPEKGYSLQGDWHVKKGAGEKINAKSIVIAQHLDSYKSNRITAVCNAVETPNQQHFSLWYRGELEQEITTLADMIVTDNGVPANQLTYNFTEEERQAEIDKGNFRGADGINAFAFCVFNDFYIPDPEKDPAVQDFNVMFETTSIPVLDDDNNEIKHEFNIIHGGDKGQLGNEKVRIEHGNLKYYKNGMLVETPHNNAVEDTDFTIIKKQKYGYAYNNKQLSEIPPSEYAVRCNSKDIPVKANINSSTEVDFPEFHTTKDKFGKPLGYKWLGWTYDYRYYPASESIYGYVSGNFIKKEDTYKSAEDKGRALTNEAMGTETEESTDVGKIYGRWDLQHYDLFFDLNIGDELYNEYLNSVPDARGTVVETVFDDEGIPHQVTKEIIRQAVIEKNAGNAIIGVGYNETLKATPTVGFKVNPANGKQMYFQDKIYRCTLGLAKRSAFTEENGLRVKVGETILNEKPFPIYKFILEKHQFIKDDPIGKEYTSPLPEYPEVYRKFYKFEGWYNKPEGGELIYNTTYWRWASNMTAYAHWTPLYKVSALMGEVDLINEYPNNANYELPKGIKDTQNARSEASGFAGEDIGYYPEGTYVRPHSNINRDSTNIGNTMDSVKQTNAQFRLDSRNAMADLYTYNIMFHLDNDMIDNNQIDNNYKDRGWQLEGCTSFGEINPNGGIPGNPNYNDYHRYIVRNYNYQEDDPSKITDTHIGDRAYKLKRYYYLNHWEYIESTLVDGSTPSDRGTGKHLKNSASQNMPVYTSERWQDGINYKVMSYLQVPGQLTAGHIFKVKPTFSSKDSKIDNYIIDTEKIPFDTSNVLTTIYNNFRDYNFGAVRYTTYTYCYSPNHIHDYSDYYNHMPLVPLDRKDWVITKPDEHGKKKNLDNLTIHTYGYDKKTKGNYGEDWHCYTKDFIKTFDNTSNSSRSMKPINSITYEDLCSFSSSTRTGWQYWNGDGDGEHQKTVKDNTMIEHYLKLLRFNPDGSLTLGIPISTGKQAWYEIILTPKNNQIDMQMYYYGKKGSDGSLNHFVPNPNANGKYVSWSSVNSQTKSREQKNKTIPNMSQSSGFRQLGLYAKGSGWTNDVFSGYGYASQYNRSGTGYHTKTDKDGNTYQVYYSGGSGGSLKNPGPVNIANLGIDTQTSTPVCTSVFDSNPQRWLVEGLTHDASSEKKDKEAGAQWTKGQVTNYLRYQHTDDGEISNSTRGGNRFALETKYDYASALHPTLRLNLDGIWHSYMQKPDDLLYIPQYRKNNTSNGQVIATIHSLPKTRTDGQGFTKAGTIYLKHRVSKTKGASIAYSSDILQEYFGPGTVFKWKECTKSGRNEWLKTDTERGQLSVGR